MEKEKSNSYETLSDVIKNGVEAGLKIASKHYHMITDIQQLLFEKDKIFRMLGEQVFHMIDQGRIFAPAIMQTTFRAAKEIIERIAHLEGENKSQNIITNDNKKDNEKGAITSKKMVEKDVKGKSKRNRRSVSKNLAKSKKSKVVNFRKKVVMKKKK